MALVRLSSAQWGFTSNCFVCEPTNPHGLRLAFFHDTDTDVVSCQFNLPADYSGPPDLVHGGVTLAILDEAQAWAAIAVCRRVVLTAETGTRFVRPIHIGRDYRVEVRVTDANEAEITTAAQVMDADGKVKAESWCRFAVVGDLQPAVARPG